MHPVAMNGLLCRDWSKVLSCHMVNLGEGDVLDDEVIIFDSDNDNLVLVAVGSHK